MGAVQNGNLAALRFVCFVNGRFCGFRKKRTKFAKKKRRGGSLFLAFLKRDFTFKFARILSSEKALHNFLNHLQPVRAVQIKFQRRLCEASVLRAEKW